MKIGFDEGTPQELIDRRELARAHLDNGNLSAATTLLRYVLQQNPSDQEAAALLVRCDRATASLPPAR
jgi:Flp pilus assembly protein TadD